MSKSVQFKSNGENVYPIVVEKVTNSNGTAIKFSDGTMICTYKASVTDQAISAQYGNTALYFGTRTWIFPVAFIEEPVVNVCCAQYSTGGSWGTGTPSNNERAFIRIYDFYSRAVGTTTHLRFLAIGRWK